MYQPTSNTTTQTICRAIITLLKTRNGRISSRYTDFLKNGIFFNIVSPDGNVCTLESEHDHCGDEVEDLHNKFHNKCF